jgi:hypothetical protein
VLGQRGVGGNLETDRSLVAAATDGKRVRARGQRERERRRAARLSVDRDVGAARSGVDGQLSRRRWRHLHVEPRNFGQPATPASAMIAATPATGSQVRVRGPESAVADDPCSERVRDRALRRDGRLGVEGEKRVLLGEVCASRRAPSESVKPGEQL